MKKETQLANQITEGIIWKQLLIFFFPIVFGTFFQQLYNTIDTIIVGHFIGKSALASVGGSSTQIVNLVVGFFTGLSSGASVIIAQFYGARDERSVQESLHTAYAFSILGSIAISIPGILLAPHLLRWMNTPKDMFGQAYGYIMVICGGIAAQVLYNLLASVLRAVGDSKRPLYFLCLSAVLNVILDLLFIIVFHMGAKGAAYATVISQGISGFLCLVYIVKKVPELHLQKEDWRIDWDLARWQMKIGFPMAFQYSITAIGTIVVQSALNMLGSVAVAGFSAATKIEQIVTQAYVALGTAMSTYCAQNAGAGRIDRIRRGFASASWMGGVYAIVTGILVFFAGKSMTILFVSENVSQITAYVDTFLRCSAVSFIFLSIVNVFRNGIQGMGYGIMPMTAGIAELVGRCGAALIASHFGSYMGICLASPAAWVLAAGLLIVMYYWIIRQCQMKGMPVQTAGEHSPEWKKRYT